MTPSTRQTLDDLAVRCHAAGLRVTPQRVAVLRCLRRSKEHPSPERLHRCVVKEMPTLSLATIYKTLDVLETLGLAHRVPTVGGALRFDGRLDEHQHLICTGCDRIFDVDQPRLDAGDPMVPGDGFVGERVQVQVFGRCRLCQRNEE